MFQVVKFKTQAAWRGQGGGWWGNEGGNKKIVLIFSFNLELQAPDMVWQSVVRSGGGLYFILASCHQYSDPGAAPAAAALLPPAAGRGGARGRGHGGAPLLVLDPADQSQVSTELHQSQLTWRTAAPPRWCPWPGWRGWSGSGSSPGAPGPPPLPPPPRL